MHTLEAKGWLQADVSDELVSVIIPTFNRRDLLKRAIESVVAQTYRPIECIVVDDGSVEDINEVVQSFSIGSSVGITFVYLRQNNTGAPAARNKGTLTSKGAYIQYLDSDDVLDSTKLEVQVAFLKNNPGCDGVFGNWNVGTIKENSLVKAYASDDLITQFLTERCITNFSFLMQRMHINLIGPWDESLKRYQEIDFHLRGVVKGGHYQYQDASTGLFISHPGSRITTSDGYKFVLQFYKKWETILEQIGRFSIEMKKKFAALYLWFFYEDIRYGATQVTLLKAVIRIDPDNFIFQTRKFQLLKTWLGTDLAVRLFLRWMIYNIQHKRN